MWLQTLSTSLVSIHKAWEAILPVEHNQTHFNISARQKTQKMVSKFTLHFSHFLTNSISYQKDVSSTNCHWPNEYWRR